jgi:hypothetical protein
VKATITSIAHHFGLNPRQLAGLREHLGLTDLPQDEATKRLHAWLSERKKAEPIVLSMSISLDWGGLQYKPNADWPRP